MAAGFSIGPLTLVEYEAVLTALAVLIGDLPSLADDDPLLIVASVLLARLPSPTQRGLF